MSTVENNNELLSVENLKVRYVTDDFTAEAVNGISFSLKGGETLGLVGETGAGKTTIALSIMGLLPKKLAEITQGSIKFGGKEITDMSEKELLQLRGKRMSMIYQDPMTSLNPIHTVGSQIAEVLQIHTELNKNEVSDRVDSLLEMVGIPKARKNEYPHQLSGGMKQRIIIAMALACESELLIADEPTTALDVTIQAQVLKMMNEIKQKINSALIFITHDLGVVVKICDNVGIVYAGEIIEYGRVEDIFTNPLHPYTKGLFGSIPNLHEDQERLDPIEGLMADPTDLPKGCKFHERCKHCMEVCRHITLDPVRINDTHQVKCHLYGEDV